MAFDIMDHSELSQDRPDPALRLPSATYYQILHTLRGLLPPPVTDAPEDHARRDDAAIAQVAAMLPVNADEAHLAALCVGARAMAEDCMRLARRHPDDVRHVVRCSAQASRMTREANSSRTLLARLQAERRRLEADPATAESAAWTEHCAIGRLTDAAAGRMHAAPPPEAPPPAPPAPPAAAAPDPDAEPARDLAAEAEQYAAVYPDRAGLIRAHGHVPDTARFGPPEDTLARAIVAGDGPNLLAADRMWAERINARDTVPPPAL